MSRMGDERAQNTEMVGLSAHGKGTRPRKGLLVRALSVLAIAAPNARAQVSPADPDADEPSTEAPRFAPLLQATSSVAFDLEGFAGLANQWSSAPSNAHAFVGGLARVRASYAQIGASMETTDGGNATALGEPEKGRWRSVSGFAGVWLPYSHWLDLEASMGVGARTYLDDSTTYGPNGLAYSVPSLSLRVGVSDRFTERLVAFRAGAEIVAAFDLKHGDAPWSETFLGSDGTPQVVTGTTPFGGVSIGVLMSVGFELGGADPAAR